MFANNYSDGFVKYWTSAFGNTESVVLVTVAVGILCICIIVFGGKWKK